MKIEIKSVLIGVLLTVNVLLLLGFDENEKKEHRYDIEYIVVADALISVMWADGKTGELVGSFSFLEKDENKRYNIYKGQKQVGNAEFFRYLKERD